MADVPSRSSSGVRLEGDDYQHLVTLNEVLRAMRGNGVDAVTVEASDTGNVDDIVLAGAAGATRYTQVKHAVDGQTPVGTTWLLSPARKGGRSLLQRFHASWVHLGGLEVRPYLQLVTDRDIDPTDPILKMIDRRTGLVVPAIRAASVQEQRAEWARHLDVSEDELVTFLEDLRFVTGRSMAAEREIAELQLQALGLVSGGGTIDSGLAFVREWVQERERTMEVAALGPLIEGRIGRAALPSILLVVEGIDADPATAQADVGLRFVELYDGDDPFSRRTLHDHADWQGEVWTELQRAAEHLRQAGGTRVVVSGRMRLPMWFGAGCALRDVLGFEVSSVQRGQRWASDELGNSLPLDAKLRTVGDEHGLAVVLSVAADAEGEAVACAAELPVGRVLAIAPTTGANAGVVPDGPTGAALAVAIRNLVRQHLDGATEEIHLFMAVPAGLALLLGHRWNALRPTVVYEHLGAGRGYARTYRVVA